ncbi:MAG: hypothetical protein ABSD76_20550 [Terriglobales bacterium]|jgi:hypothetical protein
MKTKIAMPAPATHKQWRVVIAFDVDQGCFGRSHDRFVGLSDFCSAHFQECHQCIEPIDDGDDS